MAEHRLAPSPRLWRPWLEARLIGIFTRRASVAARSVASWYPCPNPRRWLCLGWGQARSPADCGERSELLAETANAGSIEPAFFSWLGESASGLLFSEEI